MLIDEDRAAHQHGEWQGDDQRNLEHRAEHLDAERAPLRGVGGGGLLELLPPFLPPFLLRFALELRKSCRYPVHGWNLRKRGWPGGISGPALWNTSHRRGP